MFSANLLEQINHRPIGLNSLFGQTRVVTADVVISKGAFFMGDFDLLLKDFLGDQNGRYSPRPPGVEGQVGHHLGQFAFREAIGLGPV